MQLLLAKFLNENGNAFSWEGKQVTQVVDVQIRSCVVQVNGTATFCPGIFGVKALPQCVQLWRRYPSLEGGLLKDSICYVAPTSQR